MLQVLFERFFFIITFIIYFILGSFLFALDLKDMPPMNEIYHPVSTTHPEAQKSFNKGLSYIFGFNHDLAFKEFEKASQFDSNLAMAYWGMALALGQNINQDVTPENEKLAYDYAQKALTLALGASAVEQAYIKALAERYTNDPKKDLIPLRFIYRNAMKKVVTEYPEDLDAACLYAESILDLNPWKYWTDGKPQEGVEEAIDILKSALERNPNHIGANHYYIHAWEESPTPEMALLSAFRLTHLFPEGGHLLHMPNHIFLLCGYYIEAIETSKKAIAADRQYIHEYGISGEYPLHYLSHNFKVLVRAYMLSEDYENAIRASNELSQFLKPYYQKMAHPAKYLITAMEVNLYFHRWKELLALPPPPIPDTIAQAYWHLSRSLAYINLGDKTAYEKEKLLMQNFKRKIKSHEEIANNSPDDVFDVGELLLDAAEARFHNDGIATIENLKKAIEKQDHLNYDEPPAWYTSLRIELGKDLIERKRYKEAELVFKKALSQLQRNGRILYGLGLTLKEQGKLWDAYWIEREAKAALKGATQKLTFENL